MRLLFVADSHSPIARNWIAHFVEAGHQVHWVSTYPAAPDLPLASFHTVPVAFSGAAEASTASPARGRALAALRGGRLLRARVLLRHWLGPLTIPRAAAALADHIRQVGPDLVHALRIPFEGMLAAAADPAPPLIVSVWGNDFTLHAPAAPGMARGTRRALARAAALHADCRRDLGLAQRWGFPAGRPTVVLPGNGGVRDEVFHPPIPGRPEPPGPASAALARIPPEAPALIYPRGFRAYVRLDTFFRSLPAVRAAFPDARALCPAMAGDPLAESWVRRLGLQDMVVLLPRLDPQQMAVAFRRAAVAASPSQHDGTPNTLLEAMACGCVPVAGDLDSVREWIDDGLNGVLIDPRDPQALAAAVCRLLGDPGLRARAAALNLRLIETRARRDHVMARAEAFYREVIG